MWRGATIGSRCTMRWAPTLSWQRGRALVRRGRPLRKVMGASVGLPNKRLKLAAPAVQGRIAVVNAQPVRRSLGAIR